MKRQHSDATAAPGGAGRRVVVAGGAALDRACSLAPDVLSGPQRAAASLLRAYRMCGAAALDANAASESDLLEFHSPEYVEALRGDAGEEAMQEANLDGDDCPSFGGMLDYARAVAGATLQACDELAEGRADVAINCDSASGFCYVNDVVLGVLRLLKRFDRVLCLDIDVHHGDATQEAFYYSGDVLTVSLHKHGPGVFPGTGRSSETGSGRGRNCCVNVPVPGDAVGDAAFLDAFGRVAQACRESFDPEAVVLVCGADTLAGDPLGGWALSTRCIGSCLQALLEWGLPLLVTGGGGYVAQNVARAYAYCTSVATGVALEEDIPDHEGIELYAPDFTLHVDPGCADAEAGKALARSVEAALETLRKLRDRR
eukprot:m51a1_g14222 putative histone deacetylase 8-like (371) ;mRNA; r:190400-191854